MARNKKHINDKFYTKSDLSDKLISLIDIDKYDLIIEPSAGSGSFSDKLRDKNLIAILV